MSDEIIPIEQIATCIRYLRGQKVLLDSDLAGLFGVTTKVLNQAVKRNNERFPEDFMFQLTREEVERSRSQFVTSSGVRDKPLTSNRSQIVTSSKKHRGAVYRPYAFTEQGVAMLSSILRSERAVKVNIAIMRAFVKLRAALESHRELAKKFSALELRVGKHDEEIGAIIDAIRQLMAPPEKPPREIGFHVREKAPRYRTRTTKR
ncbi:ORF6N domain-containing protein [soil metagenome]